MQPALFELFENISTKNGDDFVLTALLCAAEDGDIRHLKILLELTSINVNKTNKVNKSSIKCYCFNTIIIIFCY